MTTKHSTHIWKGSVDTRDDREKNEVSDRIMMQTTMGQIDRRRHIEKTTTIIVLSSLLLTTIGIHLNERSEDPTAPVHQSIETGWQTLASEFATRPQLLQMNWGFFTRGLIFSKSRLHGQHVNAHSFSSPQHLVPVSLHMAFSFLAVSHSWKGIIPIY